MSDLRRPGASARARPRPGLGRAGAIRGVRAAAAAGAVALLGFPARIVALVALGLAQVGEFSFVLLEVGQENGLIDRGLFQTFIAAISQEARAQGVSQAVITQALGNVSQDQAVLAFDRVPAP